jgi:predicted site-specific integrase-resolvase
MVYCMPDQTELIGTAESARILEIDKTTLTRWVADGRVVPAVKLPTTNGAFLFARADIEALAAARPRAVGVSQ